MFGFAKYDYFLTKKFYVFGSVRAERDTIADLDLRFVPSVGVGYQWYERPDLQPVHRGRPGLGLRGLSQRGSEDHFAARVAYHVDWTPTKGVMLFHNLEWLPAFDNPFNDYNLNGDAGLRTTIFQGFFAEAKVELRYDSRPAPGRREGGPPVCARGRLVVLISGRPSSQRSRAWRSWAGRCRSRPRASARSSAR